MARCLVTGHEGYIGSRLFKKLQEQGHEVMGIDLKTYVPHDIVKTLREGTDGKFHPHYYNFQPEYIFHLACWPRIGYSLEKPVETMENNVLAGSILLNFAKKCGSVKRVIYSSSSSVVGNGSGPTNPYALQKYTTELEMKIYAGVFDLDTVSLRYFNVYSEDQSANGPYATVVAHWLYSLKHGLEPFITGDGEQRRDMVHVDDVVSANIFAMNYEEALNGAVFDIGTGDNVSLNELKYFVLEHHPDLNFNYIVPRPGEVAMTKANVEPLRELGWSASVSLEEGMKSCFSS
jgi:UDP-glucose 4-epimerase